MTRGKMHPHIGRVIAFHGIPHDHELNEKDLHKEWSVSDSALRQWRIVHDTHQGQALERLSGGDSIMCQYAIVTQYTA